MPSLQALIDSTHTLKAVYTQPDRRAGRGRQLTAPAVKCLALQHQLPVLQPTSLRDQAVQQQLATWNADVMVVVAYGLLLPAAVLTIPRLGCINVHASLLPRWRGAAPIQYAILAGDQQTGVSLMQMEQGLDTGPVLKQKSCVIGDTDTSGDLQQRLSVLGAEVLLATLDEMVAGRAHALAQDDNAATLAPKIQKQDAKLDWSLAATVLQRQVCAFNPAPIAFTYFNGQALRIWQALAVSASHQAPVGTLLAANKHGIDVATGDGVLRLQQLQLPGGRAQMAVDFINAHKAALIPEKTLFLAS